MPDSTLNLGLIGVGRIGRVHAANLATAIPGARLAAIADVRREAAAEVAARWNVSCFTDDFSDLLADPAIDAVVVCSSTDTHAEIIIAAAAAGKPVFCEKPIDHGLARTDEALAAAARAGVQLQVGFNRRFDANFARVRQAVAGGEIGRPQLLHIISRDPAPPSIEYVRVSGGIFLDMTIHDFDMARFLIGAEVEKVYAVGGVMIDPAIGAAGDLDTAMVTLRFANGVIGTIDNSRQAVYGYDQRAEILGSAGSVATGNNYANTAVISDAASVRRDLPLNFFMERYTASYAAEMAAFVASVREGRPALVSGADGRAAVVMGMAARRSYDEGRPVRLAEIAPA